MTVAAVLTAKLLMGSGSLNAGAGTIPAETAVSGITVRAQTVGEDARAGGEKAADGESTNGRCEGVGLPGLGVTLNTSPSAVIVSFVNTGAYTPETIQVAIEAVPAEQSEAEYYVDLFYTQTMMRIILPQVFRIIFPPLSNSLIEPVKDTSLATDIIVMEMFMSVQRIATRAYGPSALCRKVGIIYLIFCMALARLQSVWEQRLRLE